VLPWLYDADLGTANSFTRLGVIQRV